jgi:hypothetical protein
MVVILLLAGLFAGLVWWGSKPYAMVVQQNGRPTAVIETDSSEQVLDASILEAVAAYQDDVEQPDGAKSDPTYRAWSKNSRKVERDRVESETVEGYVEFRDRDHRLVRIETTSATGKPTLVSISYEAPGDPEPLIQEILRCLHERGVRID